MEMHVWLVEQLNLLRETLQMPLLDLHEVEQVLTQPAASPAAPPAPPAAAPKAEKP
jgi:hypothetical protein